MNEHVKNIMILSFLLVVILISPLRGQVITGRIVDNENTPIEYASIIGILLSDTTQIVASAYSEENGEFTLNTSSYKNVPIRLKISCIGFQTFLIDVTSEYTFENSIVLNKETVELDEVVISAYKRAITMADGKIGINVEQLSLGSTDNFLDILKRTPGLIVSNEGIKVQGNDAIVIIDGIKQRMPIGTLLNYLRSRPASNLKKIYLKTVPTAENRLAGEEATIEIYTKERTKNGYNLTNTIHGMVLRNGAYKYGDYMNLLGKYGSLSGNASVGFARSSFQSESVETYSNGQVDEILGQNEIRDKDAYFSELNLTWAPKFLKGSLNYFASYYVDDIHCNNKETYNVDETLDHFTSRDINDWTDLFSTNIEFRSADTLKYQIKASYGYLTGSDDYNQISNNNLDNLLVLEKKMRGYRHIVETKFTTNFHNFLYTIGSESYFSKINENVNSQKNSNFTMWETLIGLYTSGRYKFNKDLSAYIGLRAEYAHYKYLKLNITSKNKNWDFAPYLTIDWEVCNNFSTSLYLTMKNRRPGYFSMLPGISYINDKEYSIGNPDLKSSMQYDFKIQNLLFKYAIFTLGLRFIDNSFGTVYNLDNNDIRFTQPKNYADLLYLYGDISVPFSFLQGKLKGSLYFYLRNLSYHHVIDEIKPSAFNFYNNWYGEGNLYASYQIIKGLNIYINPFFKTQNNLLQIKRKGIMSIDMGIQYSLPRNEKWAFALSAEDIFNQLKNSYSCNYGKGHTVTNVTNPNSQCFRLSITYNLGRNSKNIRVNKNKNDMSRFIK